ncbi:class Ib ribonucleoside-diphosphate reductase assembly flavoprotein NrdI, partial [Bacillus wiedmannii]
PIVSKFDLSGTNNDVEYFKEKMVSLFKRDRV